MKQKTIFPVIASFGLLFCSSRAYAQQKDFVNQNESNHIVNAAKIPLDQNANASRMYTYPWLYAPNSYIFDPSSSNDGIYIP